MSSVAMNGTTNQAQCRDRALELKEETRTTKKLPSILSFCLHVLGLWYGSIEWIVAEPRKSTGGAEDENGNEETETSLCAVGLPTGNRNDAENQPLLKTYEETRVTKLRRNGAAIIWFAIPFLLLLCMVADLMTYMAYLWGKENDALFLVSYFTYIPQLAIIPLICVFARVRDFFKAVAPNRPPYVMTRGYFKMRRLCFAEDCNGKQDVLLFFALTFWPALNIAIIIYNFIEFEHQACGSFMIFSKCVAISGFLFYGAFAFVIVKLRQSHASEFEALATSIAQDGDITANEAKARIRFTFNAYRGFRNLLGTWSTFSTSIGVLGIFTQLYWNYSVNSGTTEVVSEYAIVTYAVMIWSEKLQFLILPLAVMRGINADYLWRGFQRVLTERLQDGKDSEKVDRLLQHARRIDTSFKWIKPTAALTLVSFYLGLQLNNQNLNYWVGPTCNITSLALE